MGRRRRRKTTFEESLIENQRSYNRYYNLLSELAIGVWKWHNLPMSVDQRYMETTLMQNGAAVFFEDEYLGDYLCLSTTFAGNFDVYGNPVRRRAYSAYNGYSKYLDPHNSVVIWNNNLRQNTSYAINQFATRLWQFDRIIDVNVNAQKTPVLVKASEEQRLTALNLYKEYDGNCPVILADDTLRPDMLAAIKTDAPFVADRIYYLKQQIWNEALTFLGIRNVNQSKKERMVTAEVDIANIDANYNKNAKLACREWACDQINEMFGLDISVEFIGEEIIAQVLPEGV